MNKETANRELERQVIDIREELIKPFAENEVEWRAQQCGINNGKPYVMAIAYVNARAIQNRLDKVFGWNGWTIEYRDIDGEGNYICKLGVYDKQNMRWIYKEDGASKTQVESFKGGMSGALKRVASSGFGIGRYLYNLDVTFAECTKEKPDYKDIAFWNIATCTDKATGKKEKIYWKNPSLPKWALPDSITEKTYNSLINNNKFDMSQKIMVATKQYGVHSLKELTEIQGLEMLERIERA